MVGGEFRVVAQKREAEVVWIDWTRGCVISDALSLSILLVLWWDECSKPNRIALSEENWFMRCADVLP